MAAANPIKKATKEKSDWMKPFRIPFITAKNINRTKITSMYTFIFLVEQKSAKRKC